MVEELINISTSSLQESNQAEELIAQLDSTIENNEPQWYDSESVSELVIAMENESIISDLASQKLMTGMSIKIDACERKRKIGHFAKEQDLPACRNEPKRVKYETNQELEVCKNEPKITNFPFECQVCHRVLFCSVLGAQ